MKTLELAPSTAQDHLRAFFVREKEASSPMGNTVSGFRDQHGNAPHGPLHEVDPDFADADWSSESDCECDDFSYWTSVQQRLAETSSYRESGDGGLTVGSFASSALQSGNVEESVPSMVGFPSSIPCCQNGGTRHICGKHRLCLYGVDDKVGWISAAT